MCVATAYATIFDVKEAIGVYDAWKISKGARDVTIAVLSTGVNHLSDELVDKINLDEGGVVGYNTCNDTMSPNDEDGIGTYMADLLVGSKNGIAPESTIIPIKIFCADNHTTANSIVKGIEYAIYRDAKILLLPIGPSQDVVQQQNICISLESAAASGMLIVLSAGNEGKEISKDNNILNCSNIDKIRSRTIVVAASNSDQSLSRYSSWHPEIVDLAAPGDDIMAVDHNGNVVEHSGTLVSATVAAGIAALVWAKHPEYSASNIRSIFKLGTVYRPTLKGKVINEGIINAHKAMTAKLN